MFRVRDVGIDLGTVNTAVYVRGRGVVLREPSVVALDVGERRVVAIGEEACRLPGSRPNDVMAVRPLRQGVIADYELTELLLREFLQRALGGKGFFRPRLVVGIPCVLTTVERRAVIDAALQAGARQAFVIEEPLAAALGAGLDVFAPVGNMVVDIGGGTTDIAVIALGGIVTSCSLRVGGDTLDEAIVRYLRQEHGLLIGERAAERLKVAIGTAYPEYRQAEVDVRGRDLSNGLPRDVRLTSAQVYEAMREPLDAIVAAVCGVLEQTPPELAADVLDRGILLTGGGALLHGMDLLLREKTGVPVYVAEDPLDCVAVGAGEALARSQWSYLPLAK